MTEEKNEFYDWLRTQFTDLESAKVFAQKWAREMNQETPFGDFTQRAMSYHISNVLEGKNEDEGGITMYITTKYGVDIYWSM